MTYAEQLKKPQWQKRRLEILERDEWTCQTCGDTEATLTVHHKSYRQEGGKFVDIWDYNGSYLITLCQECHSDEESNLAELKKNIFWQLRSSCLNSEVIFHLAFLCAEFSFNNKRRVTMPDILDILDGK